MSAKKKTRPSPSAKPAAAPASASSTAPASAPLASSTAASLPETPRTPRQKMIANVVMVVVSLYVAALCLLALDQTFKWGIFGP